LITYTQPQLWKGFCEPNKDRVFAGIAVPKGGIFHGVNLDVHLRQDQLLLRHDVMYAITGYSVPIADMDSEQDYDTIWNKQIPKNLVQGFANLDLDALLTDDRPEYEPGLVNWAGVFDMENGPRRLYRKRTLVTPTTSGSGPAGEGALTHYLPMDRVKISVAGGWRASVPTAIMFALSSPQLDQTVSAGLCIPQTDQEWMQLQYLEDTAIDALKYLIGVTSAGLQTSVEEAAVFLDKTLAPNPYEQTNGDFATQRWNITSQGSFTMSVPGTLRVGTLEGDK